MMMMNRRHNKGFGRQKMKEKEKKAKKKEKEEEKKLIREREENSSSLSSKDEAHSTQNILATSVKRKSADYDEDKKDEDKTTTRITTTTTTSANTNTTRNCRICMCEESRSMPFVQLGCTCKGAMAFAHKKCAKSWFIPLAQGKAEGLALDRNWALRWFCRCEICGHNLDERFVEELVLSCQERLKRGSTEEEYQNLFILKHTPNSHLIKKAATIILARQRQAAREAAARQQQQEQQHGCSNEKMMYATTTTTLVVPFTDEVGSPHWQRKMEMLTECETTNYIDLTTANSCEMLLRACRISCLDEKEMYFEPRETWGKVILGDNGERIAFEQQQQQQQNSPPTTSNNNKTFFVSPRNETSAHAMAQTLLMPANENECNNNNSNNSEEYPLPPLELRQRVLEQLRSIRVQTLEKDAKDFEDIERARRQGIPTSTSASVVCKIETEGYAVALTKWAASQGKDANVSKVAPCLLSSMNDARGLCATEDIQAGENILEIPRRMLLDAGTICISEQGPFGDLLRILERCGADTIMTLWIMKERMKMKTKQETFWSLYFLSLPDGSQKLTPLSWPEEIVRVGLGNMPIFETVMHERQKVRNGYDALLPSLLANCPESFEGNREEFWSYDQYISALELWMSYAMTVKPVHNSDSGTIDVLSPVAFFCNHGIYPHCVHYSQLRLSDECLVFPAMRDIEKNEEIMLSYGAKSNGELLLFYGFCIDDNPYDSIDITLDFDSLNGVEKPEVRKRREELLVKHDLTLNHAIRKNAELPIDLIATIRILCCEKELVFLYDGDPKAREISMLSESKASDALFTALSAIRSSMSSTDAIEHQAPEEWRAANQHYLNECKKYIRGLFQVIDVALEQVSMWRQTSSLAAKKLGKRTHRDFL